VSRRTSGEDFLFGDDLFGEVGDEPEDAGEGSEAAEGSGPSGARLADGSGFLLTDGPGAGSVTDTGTGLELREAAPLPGRDKALGGTLPLLIVQRSHWFYKAIPRLLAQLHAADGDSLALGVSSFMHRASVKSHNAFGDSCDAAALRIVDPAGFLADPKDVRVPEELSAQALRWGPHLHGGAVRAEDLLDLQRERSANLLLTSGRALDLSEARESVAAACDEGEDALAALKPGERLALNLTLSAEWLRRPGLLNTLLTELIERQHFGIWHIRVQWPAKTRAWSQPVDEQLLAGYRRLAQVADDEDRRLLLPQTGLTGWLMLAWGAAGFGTGLFGSNQAFLEPAGPRKKTPTIERYFERQLLHFVERTDRPRITGDPLYAQCECPYCRPLLASPGAAWSHEYAGFHYLYNAGLLTAQTAPANAGRRGPHGAVGKAVRAAARFEDGKGLSGNSSPSHLRTWDQLL
jgi:hypothetical protein